MTASTSARAAAMAFAAIAWCLVGGAASAAQPPGFSSASIAANGASLHYVRGGSGPAVILVHGFPEDWTEYRAIMPRLARGFTVVAVDMPGIGQSAPVDSYDTASLAADIHALAEALKLEKPYLVGHDLGRLTTYAYVRRFPDSLRGAMILDVPMPGVAGWDQAVAGAWHIGFFQAPGLAEKLVAGRQSALLDYFLAFGKFTPDEHAYYASIYDAAQLHAAFEIYRAFPRDAEWNAAQTAANSIPLVVTFGERSPFASLLPTSLEGYRATGMKHVDGAHVPAASHYMLADNPEAVADLIERNAGD